MKISSFKKITFTDYPGKTACAIYVMGCNFRCPFCYSPELVLPEEIEKHLALKEKDVFGFLKNENYLEAVCLSGGEPTINKDIVKFCRKVKKMGLLLKLDTNGSKPKILKELIEKKLIDYIAIDIKAPKEKYGALIGFKRDSISYFLNKIEESINIVKNSKIDYEFRTTLVPGLLSDKDILKIAHWIKPAKKYVIQRFELSKILDPFLGKNKPYTDEFFLSLKKKLYPFFNKVEIR